MNRGFSGDVMETVRGAGAKGGTVIHSRRIGNEDVTNFLGLERPGRKGNRSDSDGVRKQGGAYEVYRRKLRYAQ